MKLALNLSNILGSIQQREGPGFLKHPESILRDLEFWKRKGYEGVLLYDSGDTLDYAAGLRSVLDEAGLPVACVNMLRKNLFIPGLMDIDERRMYAVLDKCEILRPDIVDVIIAVPFPVQKGPQIIERVWYRGDYAPFGDYAVAAEKLKKFAKAVAAIGAQMSIELHDDGLHDTADNCIRLMKMIDEPNVGLNPDVGNYFRVPFEFGEQWRQQVVKTAPYANYFEIKNYHRIWDSTEKQFMWWMVDVDLGDMDFREAIKILWDTGFRGWVANEGGNGDFAQGTMGDRFASELRFARWFQEVRGNWLPLMALAPLHL